MLKQHVDRTARWAGPTLLLISVVLCVATAEIALRLFWPQTLAFGWRAPEGFWLHLPNYETVHRRSEFTTPIRTNSLGFRGPEIVLPKPPGVFRVVVLGDSFTEGAQVEERDLFTTRIEAMLTGSVPRVEVINAGVSGYGTGDELALLDAYGARLEPDLVLVSFCLQNDTMDDSLGGRCRLVDGTLRCDPIAARTGWRLGASRLNSWLASRSHLYQLVRGAIATFSWERIGLHGALAPEGTPAMPFISDRHLVPTPAYLQQGYALSEALLAAVRDRARALGAPTWLALVPVREQVREDQWQAVERRWIGRDLERDAPQRALRAIGARLGIPVIDPFPQFVERAAAGEALYWVHDAHFAPAGHRVFAEAIMDAWRSLDPIALASTDSAE